MMLPKWGNERKGPLSQRQQCFFVAALRFEELPTPSRSWLAPWSEADA